MPISEMKHSRAELVAPSRRDGARAGGGVRSGTGRGRMNRAVLAAVATLLIGAGAALGQEWPVPFGTLPELEDVPLLGKALDAEPPELPNGLHVWGGVEELLWWE